ncbi:hypothetical protein PEDI_15510 [Persicobacter diffluens]|uniref:Uncharacterized protein n=1 Tax=Persicobacter diffluens TaxID=981 RepID=A0AAN5AJG7_9BACT|nr:hypothetical protein PEDI_15510 [Persicobacter diffluens]
MSQFNTGLSQIIFAIVFNELLGRKNEEKASLLKIGLSNIISPIYLS